MARNAEPNGMASIGKQMTVGGYAAVEQGGEAPLSPEDLGDITKETPRDSRRLTRRQIITRRFWRNKGAVVGAIGFLGRDVYAMVVEGTRKSMMIGVFVALLQTGIAAVIGSSAAYFGGWWEKIALWATDLLLVVPSFLIIAILSQRAGAAKGSIALFIILLAGFGWMLTARVVRSLTLSVKNLEYVNAARAEGQRSATTYPWIFLAPAAVLVLMLLCVNVMGDGLRDAIDPSSKSGGKA